MKPIVLANVCLFALIFIYRAGSLLVFKTTIIGAKIKGYRITALKSSGSGARPDPDAVSDAGLPVLGIPSETNETLG